MGKVSLPQAIASWEVVHGADCSRRRDGILKPWTLPSGNETWQWKIHYLTIFNYLHVIFLLKSLFLNFPACHVWFINFRIQEFGMRKTVMKTSELWWFTQRSLRVFIGSTSQVLLIQWFDSTCTEFGVSSDFCSDSFHVGSDSILSLCNDIALKYR